MEAELLQEIADSLYHLEGIGVGLLGGLGLLTGFRVAEYFFERIFKTWT